MSDKVLVPVELLQKIVDALRIANDWNLDELNIEPPEEWGLELPEDCNGVMEGWCYTTDFANHIESLIEAAPEPASAEPVVSSINDISKAEAELNRLKCALQDEKVASGVMMAFWRRVFGSANMSLFDRQSMTAHMLTALSGVEVFSRNELADVECPDCGPVSVTPDIYNAGTAIGGECPYCHDRLYFDQPPGE